MVLYSTEIKTNCVMWCQNSNSGNIIHFKSLALFMVKDGASSHWTSLLQIKTSIICYDNFSNYLKIFMNLNNKNNKITPPHKKTGIICHDNLCTNYKLAKHTPSTGFPSPSEGTVPSAPIWKTAFFGGSKRRKKIGAPGVPYSWRRNPPPSTAADGVPQMVLKTWPLPWGFRICAWFWNWTWFQRIDMIRV